MTTLGAYDSIFTHRVTALRPTAADAAQALFSLNHDCKSGMPLAGQQATIYELKSRLLEAFWRAGFCYRVITEETADGFLWAFTFCIQGVVYRWHGLPEDVTFGAACMDEPLPAWAVWAERVEQPANERLAIIRAYLRRHGGTR